MKKLILVFLVISNVLFGQSAGNSGFSFLKIGSDARNIGAGDFGFYDGNISSAMYNPASLIFSGPGQISFTHNSWIQDVNSEIIGASVYLFGLPVGVNINTTSISGFEIRSNPTVEPEASFSINYFYAGLSSAFSIYDSLSFGITAKYLYEGILSDESTGYGFDFGMIYNGFVKGLKLGLSARNLGKLSKLRNNSADLPADFRIGANYQFLLEQINSDIIILGGVQKYLNQDETHIHLGTEISYDRLLSIRFGYFTGYDSKGLSAGLGINWNMLGVDYSLTPFNYGLGNAHTISVKYQF